MCRCGIRRIRERYLLSRARAPALVTAEDIMEFDLNSDPVDQQGRRMFLERYIHGEAFARGPTSTPWCTATRRPSSRSR